MSISAFAGPLVSFGQSPYESADQNPEIGPSLFFGGAGILDPRIPFAYTPGQDFGAVNAGFLGIQDVVSLNILPYTKAVAAIAAAANTTASTAMTLVSSSSASTGIAVAQSIVRADTGATVTGLLGIDAYTSVTGYISNGTSGTAGNILIVSAASAGQLTIGMVISGTGIPANTKIIGYGPTVNATDGGSGDGNTGSYTVSGAPFAAGTSSSQLTITASLGNSTLNAVAAERTPFGSAGTIQLWNPMALTARAVSITTSVATVGTTNVFTVVGYDIYGYPMSEAISVPSTSVSGTTVNGKKAFKFITSVTPSVTDATTSYSVGTTDIFGLPLRSDYFGNATFIYPGTGATNLVTSVTGYTPAVTTLATTTTGDVRGTYALQTAASTGTNRLIVRQSPALYNISSATGLFGVTQA
jgi:hypothetical protein